MEKTEEKPLTPVMGIPYFGGGMEMAIALSLRALREGRALTVFTPGATVAALAARERALLPLLARADLVLPDGKGVSLAARLSGAGRLSSVGGIDFAEALFAACAPKETRVFLYGAAPGVAERAAAGLREKHPHLIIAAADGYGEDPARRIAAFRPQILCVGLGAPRQEMWIDRNKSIVGGVMIGVGGALDVWAGDKRRAPRVIRCMGLEWAWRTLWEPKRFPRLLPLPRYFFACLRFRQNAKKRERKCGRL